MLFIILAKPNTSKKCHLISFGGILIHLFIVLWNKAHKVYGKI